MGMTLHCYEKTVNHVVLYYQAKWLVNYTCNHKNILCVHILLLFVSYSRSQNV